MFVSISKPYFNLYIFLEVLENQTLTCSLLNIKPLTGIQKAFRKDDWQRRCSLRLTRAHLPPWERSQYSRGESYTEKARDTSVDTSLTEASWVLCCHGWTEHVQDFVLLLNMRSLDVRSVSASCSRILHRTLQWEETQYSPHSASQLELVNNSKSFPLNSVLFAE